MSAEPFVLCRAHGLLLSGREEIVQHCGKLLMWQFYFLSFFHVDFHSQKLFSDVAMFQSWDKIFICWKSTFCNFRGVWKQVVWHSSNIALTFGRKHTWKTEVYLKVVRLFHYRNQCCEIRYLLMQLTSMPFIIHRKRRDKAPIILSNPFSAV